MLYRIIYIVILLLSAYCTSAHADTEPWYTFWSIGFANINYAGETGEVFDMVDSMSGMSRMTFSLDTFGFYWPMENEQTILGFVVNGAADTLYDAVTTFSLNQYLYGFSTMHFIGSEPGDGFLVRGDIGFTKAIMSLSGGGYSESASSDWRIGYLIGIGYGIPVSKNSRIIFSLNFASRDIEGDRINTVGLTIGGLW